MTSPSDMKTYLIETGFPVNGWCITGLAFLPTKPNLYEDSQMAKSYTVLEAPAFSLIYWTTSSCLVNDPVSDMAEEISPLL